MRTLLFTSLTLILACGSAEQSTGEGGKQQAGQGPNDAQAPSGKTNGAAAAEGTHGGTHQAVAGNEPGRPDGHHDGPIEFAAAPADAKVYFTKPQDGEVVQSPFEMEFQVEGMRVAPADGPVLANEGHHHIIVDGASITEAEAVPSDDTHIHYGKGQIKAELALEAGEHTLTLQFADGRHRSFGPALSKTIQITVEGDNIAADPDPEGTEAPAPDAAPGGAPGEAAPGSPTGGAGAPPSESGGQPGADGAAMPGGAPPAPGQ